MSRVMRPTMLGSLPSAGSIAVSTAPSLAGAQPAGKLKITKLNY